MYKDIIVCERQRNEDTQKRRAVVVHACNPSYLGDNDSRIKIVGQLGQKVRPYLKE
jgi:hypothetical protein